MEFRGTQSDIQTIAEGVSKTYLERAVHEVSQGLDVGLRKRLASRTTVRSLSGVIRWKVVPPR